MRLRFRRALRLSLWSLALTALQVFFAILWVPHSAGFAERELQLLNWDSDHYRAIAQKGYQTPGLGVPITSDDIHAGRANVVFLPGYPLTARAASQGFGISADAALLVVAQLSCFLFWIYFFLFLDLAGVSRRSQWWSAFAVVVHPAAFYMIAGYTESLFLLAMFGYFYWCERERTSRGFDALIASLLAVVHGLLMCWTRIVGVAVAIYPVARGGLNSRFRAFLIFGISVLSLLGFFYFCQVRFGDWAIYFHLEEIGWQNERKYFAIFNPLMYLPRFFFEDTIQSLNKAAVTFTGFLIVILAQAEMKLRPAAKRGAREWLELIRSRRGVLFCVAFGMFYIALTGKANSNLDSMLRYTFPSYILFVLQIAELNLERRATGASTVFFAGAQVGNRRARLKLWASVVVAVGFQAWCIYRYTHGHWVA